MIGSLVINIITQSGESLQFNSIINYSSSSIHLEVDKLINHYSIKRQQIRSVTFTAHPITITRY